jgi:hypothetical protein
MMVLPVNAQGVSVSDTANFVRTGPTDKIFRIDGIDYIDFFWIRIHGDFPLEGASREQIGRFLALTPTKYHPVIVQLQGGFDWCSEDFENSAHDQT